MTHTSPGGTSAISKDPSLAPETVWCFFDSPSTHQATSKSGTGLPRWRAVTRIVPALAKTSSIVLSAGSGRSTGPPNAGRCPSAWPWIEISPGGQDVKRQSPCRSARVSVESQVPWSCHHSSTNASGRSSPRSFTACTASSAPGRAFSSTCTTSPTWGSSTDTSSMATPSPFKRKTYASTSRTGTPRIDQLPSRSGWPIASLRRRYPSRARQVTSMPESAVTPGANVTRPVAENVPSSVSTSGPLGSSKRVSLTSSPFRA